jgi:putative transposase
MKHGLVHRVADWPYSSFHRYVHSGILPPDWAGGNIEKENANYGEPRMRGENRSSTSFAV